MNGTKPKKHKGKNPAFQFYPADWLRDPALRSVTSGARGLWIDMLCLMWDCVPRGYLQTMSGKPFTAEMICRMSGNISKEEVDRWLAELEDSGVLSRSTTGVFYSRRMVRDEQKRVLCQEAGKKGGNPTLNRQSKGDSKGDSKGQSNPNPTPSSSSSTSVDPKGSTPPNPLSGEGECVDSEPPARKRKSLARSVGNASADIAGIEANGTLLMYDNDQMVWEAAFIQWWNSLQGVSKRGLMTLDTTMRNNLIDRLCEPDWFWKRTQARFPLWTPSAWTPTLNWFLEPGSVSNILGGKYAAQRTDQAGLFGNRKPDPTRVRSGDTTDVLAAAMAQATAARGE